MKRRHNFGPEHYCQDCCPHRHAVYTGTIHGFSCFACALCGYEIAVEEDAGCGG